MLFVMLYFSADFTMISLNVIVVQLMLCTHPNRTNKMHLWLINCIKVARKSVHFNTSYVLFFIYRKWLLGWPNFVNCLNWNCTHDFWSLKSDILFYYQFCRKYTANTLTFTKYQVPSASVRFYCINSISNLICPWTALNLNFVQQNKIEWKKRWKLYSRIGSTLYENM